MNGKWVAYRDNGVKCYLIVVINKDMTTDYIYAHGQDMLDRRLKELCSDENDSKVYDFKVFERMNIDIEY